MIFLMLNEHVSLDEIKELTPPVMKDKWLIETGKAIYEIWGALTHLSGENEKLDTLNAKGLGIPTIQGDDDNIEKVNWIFFNGTPKEFQMAFLAVSDKLHAAYAASNIPDAWFDPDYSIDTDKEQASGVSTILTFY